MANHTSFYGTTCWFCGWPAGAAEKTTRLDGGAICRSCRNCRHAAGTREEVRATRDADVEGAKALMRGEAYTACYWTQAKLEEIARNQTGLPPDNLDVLKAKEYADPFAGATQARVEENKKEYARKYSAAMKEERKKFYAANGGKEAAAKLYAEGGGKEAAARRYAEGGGKEYAREYYLKKKAAKAVKVGSSEYD